MSLPNNGGNVIKEVSKKILKHYGLRHQKAKAIEELGELIVALQKDLLAGTEGLSPEVLEEIADVHIMITQLLAEESYRTTVSLIVEKKLKRQIRRMNNER
nr:MAG TPA: nucleoside triphosphate pyrophosphohydrolase [Caudoviricetes sp.]